MRRTRQRLGPPIVFVAFALAALAIATWLAEGPREMNDLEVFHRAGGRFIRGEALYRAADGHFEFKYLPVSAALFAPLSLVSLSTSKALWLGVCWLSLSFAFALSSWLLRARLPAWGPPVALLVLARSIEREYANGQANALLLLMVVGSFVLLEKRRDAVAGGLLGVAMLLKPHWLVLLPYLLVTRRWNAAAMLACTVTVGLFLPVARYGVSGTLGLHEVMSSRLAASTARLLTYPTNISLPGALAKLTGGGLPTVASMALVALAVPLLVLGRRVWGERLRLAEDLAVLAPLVLLLSPQAWDYTVLTTLPALLLMATAARRARWTPRVVTVILCSLVACDFIVLFGRGVSYEAVMRWSPNTWFLVWILGAGTWLRAMALSDVAPRA